MDANERKLLRWYAELDDSGREQLLAFAEFLHGRRPADEPSPPSEPLAIPRPTKESVVKAIKRLSDTYPMINRDEMLHESAALMSEHIMHGRPASEVIDELETLFSRRYNEWCQRLGFAESAVGEG